MNKPYDPIKTAVSMSIARMRYTRARQNAEERARRSIMQALRMSSENAYSQGFIHGSRAPSLILAADMKHFMEKLLAERLDKQLLPAFMRFATSFARGDVFRYDLRADRHLSNGGHITTARLSLEPLEVNFPVREDW